MRRATVLGIALALCTAASPERAAAGVQPGSFADVGVLYDCEGASDGAASSGTNPREALVYDFAAGGANFARVSAGWSGVVTHTTRFGAEAEIALPTGSAGDDCSLGASIAGSQTYTYTGVYTDTLGTRLQIAVDGTIQMSQSLTATVSPDGRLELSFDVGGTSFYDELFLIDPLNGPIPQDDPAAWTITPLGGGLFSIRGTPQISQTLSTQAPGVVQVLTSLGLFAPGGTTSISAVLDFDDGLAFELVSTNPLAEVVAQGAPPPDDPQSRDQQRCLFEMNKRAAKIAAAQGKVTHGCVKDATRGKVAKLGPSGTAQGCAVDDPKGKVAKQEQKLVAAEARSCLGAEQQPDFGYTGSQIANDSARGEMLSWFQALLGPDLDAALRQDRGEIKCQDVVQKLGSGLAAEILKEAAKAKRQALKDGVGSAQALEDAIFAALEQSARLGKRGDKLAARTEKSCGGIADLFAVFPGTTSGIAAPAVASFAEAAARCVACRALDAIDALARDCDEFDDGTANGSCPESS